MGTPTPKRADVKAGLLRKARMSQEWAWVFWETPWESQKWPWISQWSGASIEAISRVSWGSETSDGASPCESKRQAKGVPGW